MVISPALVRPQAHTPCPGGAGRADSGAGGGASRPEGARHTFLSKAKEKCAKESQRHGDSRGGPPRCAPRASVCGSRTVGRPEFIRGVQFRPLGRNSLTTFRGQTALRGCPRPRLAALTRRKKALIAHFDGGARNVARNGVGQLHHTSGARSCSPFSAVKMGGPFSLRCLSPLCSPAVGAGQTQMAMLGMFVRLGGLRSTEKRA